MDAFTLPNIIHLTTIDAISKIDTEIARLEDPEQIRVLKQFRNTVIPIACFPTEILSKVFLHSHKLDTGSSGYGTRLIISWISRHWRNTALGYPVLWSSIYIANPDDTAPPCMTEYVQECFLRSRRSPLTLEYSGPRSQLLTICSSQIHRITDLRLAHLLSDNQLDSVTDEWQQPVPLLIHLELSGVDLQGGIFGGEYPPLQTLTLDSCAFGWESPISNLSTLTKLEVYHPEDFLTAAEVAEKLKALPALRFCKLSGCLLFASIAAFIEPDARLPHLESLTIVDDNLEGVVELLQRLDIPNASLDILYEVEGVLEEAVDDGFQWFGEYQRQRWKDIDNVSIRRGIKLYLDSFSVSISASSGRRFTFGVACQLGEFEFDPLAHVYQYLSLHNVRDLSFDEVSVEGLTVFTSLPCLESLAVQNVGAEFVGWARRYAEGIFPSVTNLVVNGTSYPGFEGFISENDENEVSSNSLLYQVENVLTACVTTVIDGKIIQ